MKKNFLTLLMSGVFASLVLVSCKKDEEVSSDEETSCVELEEQVATGKFFGETFTLVEGTAEENWINEDEYEFTFYGEEVSGDACDDWNFSKPKKTIHFYTPKAIGEYEIKASDFNLRFNDATVVNTATVEYATCGKIYVDEITESTIKGRVVGHVDGNNTINGSFSVQLCD